MNVCILLKFFYFFKGFSVEMNLSWNVFMNMFGYVSEFFWLGCWKCRFERVVGLGSWIFN